MAGKKPKTPPPPRPVQAPRKRTDAKRASRSAADTHRALLYGIAAAGAVALVAIVAVVALAGGKSSSNDKHVAALMSAAGCDYRPAIKIKVPGGQTHVASLTAKLPWQSSPPAGGQHYPEWAVWGFYTAAVNPRMVVHNEEHGGVILWWGSKVPASTVNALHDLYDASAVGMVGTPYPQLGSRIAITAWTGNPAHYFQNGDFGIGHIATCAAWSPKVEKAFVAFRDAYRGHGPEGIPLSQDEPGMGPSGAMQQPTTTG